MCLFLIVIRAGKPQHARQFKTSTPETRSPEPVTFDPDRICAWLGQTHQLCSKAVQTEHVSQVHFAWNLLIKETLKNCITISTKTFKYLLNGSVCIRLSFSVSNASHYTVCQKWFNGSRRLLLALA